MKPQFLILALASLAWVFHAPVTFAQQGDKPTEEKPRAERDRQTDRDQPRRAEEKAPGRAETRPAPDRPAEPRGERDREPDKRGHHETPRDEETRTFLGVATSPVHPAVREHLDLAEGFGIQIEHVMEDSPAAEAGMQKSDVLILLDEQKLTNPEHLSLLVRSMEPGTEISLTFIRKGKEQSVDLQLGETAESDFGRVVPGPVPMNRWHESMERNQDYWRGWMDQNREKNPRPRGEEEAKPHPPGPGRPPAVSVRPGFPVQIFGASGIIKIDNDEGELTITQENGEHLIEMKDRDGNVVYAGEFDPAEGVEGLPEKARDHLKVMKLENLEVLTPPAEQDDVEETGAQRAPARGGQPL